MKITWNSQGFKKDEYLSLIKKMKKGDILCLQECGSYNPMYQYAARENSGSYSTFYDEYGDHQVYVIYWENIAAGNARCSLAMMIKFKNESELSDMQINTYFAESYKKRPMLVLQWDDIILGTTHCPSTNNSFSRKVRNELSQILINYLPGKKWQLIGDFNCTPDNTIDNTILEAPDIKTQDSGRILDYMVRTNESIQLSVKRLDKPNGQSDHWPVRFS